MKNSLKNFLLLSIFIIGFSAVTSAQINKADVETMLSKQGTTLGAIKKVYVHNVKQFYTDGTAKYVYDEYADLTYWISDRGIFIQGKTVQFFPFSTMRHISVSETLMTIHLL
jgi:hypothetical protein